MRTATPAGNDLESDPTVDDRSVGRPVTRLRPSGWLLLACAALGCSEKPAPAQLTVPSEAATLRAAYVSAVQRDADPSYAAVTVRPGALRFETATQQLTTQLDRQRVQVAHHSGGGVDLTLSSYGCAMAPTRPEPVVPVALGNRVEYHRPGLREWYANGPLGLEQGFVVDAPAHQASCGEKLVLRLGLAGSLRPSLSADHSYLDLRSESGQPVLRYQDLYAQDATGRALPTGLALVGSQVELWIDDAAATYPITVDPLLRWVEQQKLIASDAATNSYLGVSAAISGDTAILGASGLTVMGKAYAGGAYVFVRSGTTWTEQAKLTTTDAASNALGDAVALSGDTAVLGARFVDGVGKTYAGAAYVFVRSGTTWTQQAKLVHPTPAAFDYFGTSVAVSGDTVLVGSPRTDSSGLGDSGAAYVFVRTGTTWTKQAELLAGDIRIQGQFGSSVALDGNEAVIGAPWQWSSGFSPRSGEVYVFSRSGTTWTQTASLQAADGAMDDYLGTSVAFFGNLLVAGAPGVDLPAAKTAAGAAYLFARSGSTWTQAAKLTAPDAAKDDGFGTAVSAASDTVAIAAPGADLPSKTEAGAVYLFTNGAGSWALRTKLVASDAAAAQSFGYGLSLSDDTLVVGASGSAIAGKTSAGAGYVYAAVAAKTDGTACTDASECQSNFCVDGVCCSSACGSGDAGDCQACAVAKGAVRDGTCAPVKMGTTCRIAVGLCDDAEVCDGTATACPANRVKAAGTVCRPAGGDCDVAEVCDDLQGMVCNPDVGACDGVCALQNLQFSYIGCDYYPTITLQHDSYNSGTKVFAAVIANTAGQDAQITITRGAMMIDQFTVKAGDVKEVPLKWVPELTKGIGPSKLTVDGAYRVRSDHPVTVYQYNLLYADASNDASLLLPVNAWTGEYVVASYPHAAINNYPGFYAIVAREDGTTVTLSPSATGTKVQAGAGVGADGIGQARRNGIERVLIEGWIRFVFAGRCCHLGSPSWTRD